MGLQQSAGGLLEQPDHILSTAVGLEVVPTSIGMGDAVKTRKLLQGGIAEFQAAITVNAVKGQTQGTDLGDNLHDSRCNTLALFAHKRNEKRYVLHRHGRKG